MQDRGYSTESFYRVYDDSTGNALTIRPSPDFPTSGVLLTVEGKDNIDYFGDIRLDLPKEMMRQVGQALINVANSLKGEYD